MASQADQPNASQKTYRLGKKDYTYDEFMNTDILELMGAQDMPDDQKKEVYKKMMETIEMRVFQRIDDMLDDADIPEFKKLLDGQDKAGLEKFLEKKKIDLASLFVQESFLYKIEMVGLAQNLED